MGDSQCDQVRDKGEREQKKTGKASGSEEVVTRGNNKQLRGNTSSIKRYKDVCAGCTRTESPLCVADTRSAEIVTRCATPVRYIYKRKVFI